MFKDVCVSFICDEAFIYEEIWRIHEQKESVIQNKCVVLLDNSYL